MKILVLGCNGMAGHLISLYFKEQGHEVVGFARQQSALLDTTVVGDASDFPLIQKTIEEGGFDAVINCIGLLNQFAEENKAMAVLLNGYLPHWLTEITKDTTTRIIHMSTDCVFAGNDGPYYEDSFPMQAVRTNVIGTENVLDSAVEHGVKNVVVLSTDKAAYPINAMGISKAMMEKVAIAKARSLENDATTTICCTRYGNVMASRGSVIPLWVEQIKSGNSITITDPNMTRYMMTLDDALNLVLYAFEHGNNGDLFVQKAPAATLEILAESLKELYNAETEVRVIGTRHGEKLYETLVTREEMAKSEDMGNYYRIPCDSRDLNYDKYFVEGEEKVSKFEDYNSHNTKRLDLVGMQELLLRLEEIKEDIC